MVASDAFAEFLREQLAPVGHITMRRMFGKTGVFCDGVMLGMVMENTLYVRVDDQNRATFKEAESVNLNGPVPIGWLRMSRGVGHGGPRDAIVAEIFTGF